MATTKDYPAAASILIQKRSSMKSSALSLLALTLIVVSASAVAQTQAESKPVWEVGAFVGAISGPAYPGAEDRTNRVLPLPYFIYRGTTLRAEQGSVGARLIKTPLLEFDLGFNAALAASSKDVKIRAGMPDLAYLFEVGPRVRLNLARPTDDSLIRLDLPLRGVVSVDGKGFSGRGATFAPELSYDKRNIGYGWGLNVSASAIVGSRGFNEYLYGVAPIYSTLSRPQYTAKSGLVTTRLTATVSNRLTPDALVFAFARLDESSNAANRESPLFRKKTGATIGVGLAYTLFRSQAKTDE